MCIISAWEGRPPKEVSLVERPESGKGGTLLGGGGENQNKTLLWAEPERGKAQAGAAERCLSSSPPLRLPKPVNAPDMSQPRPRYVVDRAAYSLTLFDDEFEKKDRTYPLGEKLRNAFR